MSRKAERRSARDSDRGSYSDSVDISESVERLLAMGFEVGSEPCSAKQRDCDVARADPASRLEDGMTGAIQLLNEITGYMYLYQCSRLRRHQGRPGGAGNARPRLRLIGPSC